ncbi:MAG: topoisomerase DNA-binding C4 zinc finger domain-containing protein [Oscillospiraceae bacterium]|nr:topoisomerase DNA-binding C4 zinc finger domain-containing protein [Oscillospiraceae bacterium]MCR4759141.1 topoisomerase DNA-binding C4 zinc finger domain-containing protein [Oscillospiraceae bacterium]
MQCPRCGAAMVLRTANKGANAGKQFYGCSAFPKCRFIQTVPEPVSDYRGALYLE